MKAALATLCLALPGLLVHPASSPAQQPGHAMHPPMPDQQLFFQYRLLRDDQPIVVRKDLDLQSPSWPAELDQVVTLPAPLAPVRLTRYLPAARLEQKVVADASGQGKPALEISINGPTQSHQRWLTADDPERNQVASFIGTWRYMSVADEPERDLLRSQFDDELTREPKLRVGLSDGTAEQALELKVGQRQELAASGCAVLVRSFFPHYAMNLDKKEPVNRSKKRMNPAVLVEIEHQGKKESRWVFAKFPAFTTGGSNELPIRIELDCPVDREQSKPDFVLVTIARAKHEVWARHEGQSTHRSLKIGEKLAIPGSQYTFRMVRFEPSGRLIEDYHPADGEGAVTALLVEFSDASGQRRPLWLQLGQERAITTAQGRATLAFGSRSAGPPATPTSGGPASGGPTSQGHASGGR